MKRILIAILLAASTVAQADNIASAENKAGGRIWLTDTSCKDRPKLMIAYSTGRDGSGTIFGCWGILKPNVLIHWDSGDVSTLPGVMFEMVEADTPATRRPGAASY